MRDAGEIERGIAAFALKSGGGLIVTITRLARFIAILSSSSPLGTNCPRSILTACSSPTAA
jgi:hypothetical protein